MIVAVQGSRNFDEYSIFLRAMGTALSMMEKDDDVFIIYAAGPVKINSMATEFANVSERSLKARGIKARVKRVPISWLKDNLKDVEYFAYFSKPKEAVSDLVEYAETINVEVGVYRY
jgi:hypothetical protein